MRSFLLTALALLSLGQGMADTTPKQQYLTLRTAEGVEHSFPIADGLRVVFDDSQLHIFTAETESFAAPLTGIPQLWFAATPTSISALPAGADADTAFAGGQTVRIFTLDGRLAGQYTVGSTIRPELPAGVYMFQSGTRVVKQLLP